MPTGFSFQVQGLDKLINVFNKLPVTVQNELGAELKTTAAAIRDGAKKAAPADEARLRQSISTKTISKTEFEVVAQTFYAGYLEFGTKTKVSIPAGLEEVAAQLKGPVSGQGNPFESILAWVKRKQIGATMTAKGRVSKSKNAQAQQRSVAFMIWRHIRRFGIKPHPFFFKQMGPAEQKLRQRVANIIKQII